MGIEFEKGKKEMKNLTNDEIEKLYSDSIFTCSAEAFATSKGVCLNEYDFKGFAADCLSKDGDGCISSTKKTAVGIMLELGADTIVDLKIVNRESSRSYANLMLFGTALVKREKEL